MASSSVEIAANALRLIGYQPITALTDDSDGARIMNALYTPTLDEALRSHDWNFARLRALLARLQDTPAYDYAYMYQLPQQPLCLRVLATNLAATEKWEIETYITSTSEYRVLLTDATTVTIRYIGRITNPTTWDPLFSDAMTWELAFRAAGALRVGGSVMLAVQKEKELRWSQARSVDGQEGRPLRKMLSDTLTRVRF